MEDFITQPHESVERLAVLIDPDIAAALRPLTADENDGLRIKLKAEGCREKLLYFRLGNECYQLDGHHRRRICEEEGISFEWHEVKSVTSKLEALEWVREHQASRRNSTSEEITAFRLARLERVAEAKRSGQSNRAIAGQVGISESQVRRDLEAATKVSSDKTGEQCAVGGAVTPPDGKIIGQDGRQQPSTKPKLFCTHCQTLVRIFLEPKKNCPMCKELRSTGKKREKKPDQPTEKVDAFGTPIPKRCCDAFCDPWIQEAIDFIGGAKAEFWAERLADGLDKRKKHYPFYAARLQDFIDGVGMVGNTMAQLLEFLKENRPAGVCPSCDGKGCSDCRMSGLVPRALYEKLATLSGHKSAVTP